ncbi:MAG: hypothetical protein COA78_11625 [Blastopirellula sp.]|nr:MAG: hypothetical protein COA78_11625 [Blastopirellula sp.]
MLLKDRSTIGKVIPRFTSVLVCLFAISFLVSPQIASATWAESTESESPLEESKEKSEEEAVASASRCRRGLSPKRCRVSYQVAEADYLCRFTSYSSPLSTIAGHQLLNGLCAPLLI